MLKLVILPPIDDFRRDFATQLPVVVPELEVVIAHTDADVIREMTQADAVYGWMSSDALKGENRIAQ